MPEAAGVQRQNPDSQDRRLPVQIEDHRAVVPVLIARAGDRAGRRFLEFFAATLRNRNTRAVGRFFAWCEQEARLHELGDIEPLQVAASIELLRRL